MAKILFLTTAHNYNDDRIFHHQAKELKNEGYEVKICSLYSDFTGNIDGIDIESYSILTQSSDQKSKKMQKVCKAYQPDCIICSEPLAVIAASKFNAKKKPSIIYDVTEWYPSLRMIAQYSWFLKPFHAFKFLLIQLYAGFKSSQFIFGERSKMLPLVDFFPFKKRLILPYYPSDNYINQSINKLNNQSITLGYTGRISEEDGIGNFFNAIKALQEKKPNLRINILIVGKPKRDIDEQYFSQLLQDYSQENVVIKPPVAFENFTESFAEADICFDLREHNFEYSRSLPIKIFYYMAAGKPVIYTNLKAIGKHLDIKKFGHLVNPKDANHIAEIISNYIDNPDFYNQHAQQARKEYESKYNWGNIRNSFNTFIAKSIKQGEA